MPERDVLLPRLACRTFRSRMTKSCIQHRQTRWRCGTTLLTHCYCSSLTRKATGTPYLTQRPSGTASRTRQRSYYRTNHLECCDCWVFFSPPMQDCNEMMQDIPGLKRPACQYQVTRAKTPGYPRQATVSMSTSPRGAPGLRTATTNRTPWLSCEASRCLAPPGWASAGRRRPHPGCLRAWQCRTPSWGAP